jgi:phosphoribosylformylglycinamidine synthase
MSMCCRGGRAALEKANTRLWPGAGRADEIDYLVSAFTTAGAQPDRRGADDVRPGQQRALPAQDLQRPSSPSTAWRRTRALFGMIRNTHQIGAPAHGGGLFGQRFGHGRRHVERFVAKTASKAQGTSVSSYEKSSALQHVLMKVETHNHPTAISPFPGASTGAGGEIRDEGATGRGSKPKAGLTGFTVSKLWGGWSDQADGKPAHIASPLQIMVEGPLGGAAFNNEFGRPNLLGYFREYEQTVASDVDTVQRGYHKPIMIAGGLGTIDAGQTQKIEFPAGTLLMQLGGPGMRIGMGGSAASSMATGANAAELDFDSVQRGNPEIERRAQEVINHCWA